MNINNLTEEEIMKFIFINENQYYTFDYIKNKLDLFQRLYFLDQEKANLCLINLNVNNLFLNIDLYYEMCLDKKQIGKMHPSEIIRYIVRNTYKDSNYGNFHNIEYHFIKSIITNGFIKLHLSNKKINECIEYLEKNLDCTYDCDRYILNPIFFKDRLKKQVIYNKIAYKIRNLFIVYNDNSHHFCIRHRINKYGEISLYGDISKKKYYKSIIYDYYDIKTGDFICESDTNTYQIESLYVFNNIFEFIDGSISLKKLEEMIEIPVSMFNKPKIKQL